MRVRTRVAPLVVAILMVIAAGVVYRGQQLVGPDPGAPAGFVYREGAKLMLNGQQYKFAGLNATTWFGCWTGEKEATTDDALDRYFRELSPRSMTRIWHYPGRTDLDLMRRIEAAAARHGQYLMVTLTDGNDGGRQCGGLPLNYADPAPMLAHVRAVVPPFANSATVAVWEVCNECSIAPGQTKAWYRSITDELKRLAPNTLVALGGSCYRTYLSVEDCVNTFDLPGNDLISFQEFDDDGGDASHWADETAEIAERLGKPAFVGETGVADNGGDCGAYDCNARRMVQEFDSYLADTEFAGVLWWDFKWTRDNLTTVNLDNPYWSAISQYRHPYNGGGTPPPSSSSLVSQRKPVTASSVVTTYAAAAAVDGDTGTRWSSDYADPQWIQIDLGATYSITRVELNWQVAYGKRYQIQTSQDGITWTVAAATMTGDGGLDDLAVKGSGRYVRLFGTVRGSPFGYSLWEFKVYGGRIFPSPTTVVNDNTTGTGPGQFEYSAGWKYMSGSAGKYEGDLHFAETAGTTATFRFTGTQVKWFGPKASHHGIGAVSIDGGPETLVDLYAATRQEQALLYTSPTLPSGPHTLRIRFTGTKNAASSGTVISIDKAEITS